MPEEMVRVEHRVAVSTEPSRRAHPIEHQIVRRLAARIEPMLLGMERGVRNATAVELGEQGREPVRVFVVDPDHIVTPAASVAASSAARSIRRDGPAPGRSNATSARSRSAREREVALGLPDNPMTAADTYPPQKTIGRDSNRGVAADHGAFLGAKPRCYLMSSQILTRQTVRSPDNTWSGMHNSTSAWWLASLSGNLDQGSSLCNHGIHRQPEFLVNAAVRRG